nr:RNA-directed DNA polymerase, eukaryota, nucleotide-binding alpha-beta plait domain protein [Tanacetum cinerariifolium]
MVRYQRPHKPKVFIPREQPFPETTKGSFAYVLKEDHKAKDATANNEPTLVLDDSCLRDFDFSASIMGQVKDLAAIPNMKLEECVSNSLCKLLCLKIKSDVFINERQKILIKGKVYWIYAKEKKPWVPIFLDDTTDKSSNDESQDEGSKVKLTNDEAKGLSDVEKVLESSFMQESKVTKDEPEFPPGFTLVNKY